MRFKALGYIELEDEAGSSAQAILRRPKQVALFSVVVIGDAAVRSTERLMGLFWPESDPTRARRSLNQALYQIKRELGELIIREGDHLRVDRDALWCDVVAFQEAVKQGDAATAAALYRGDLLEGLYVSDAPEFERWVEPRRRRLRRAASSSLWTLAEEQAAAADFTHASTLAHRAAGLAPGEEASARRLLGFLDGIGDRAGALTAYDEFARVLWEEYEVEPSPETQRLVQQIRQRTEAWGSFATQRPDLPEWAALEARGAEAPSAEDRPPKKVTRGTGTPDAGRPLLGTVGAVASVLALATIAWFATSMRGNPPTLDELRIAVVDGRSLPTASVPAGGPVEPDVAGVTAQRLTLALAGVEGLRLVPAGTGEELTPEGLGEELEVSAVVAVDAFRTASGVQISLGLIDTDSSAVMDVAAFPDTVAPGTMARFVRERLGDWERRERLGPEAPNLEALALVLAADELSAEAARHLGAARADIAQRYLIEADSVLAEAEAEGPGWIEPVVRRIRVAHQLTLAVAFYQPLDSARVHALFEEAEAHAARALALDPDSPFAHDARGANRWMRYSTIEPENSELRDAAESDIRAALRENPRIGGAWVRLARLSLRKGDPGGALIAAQRALEVDTHLRADRDTRRFLLQAAAYIGDRSVADRACAEGLRDFPLDWVFEGCRLFLMAWFPELADEEAIQAELARTGQLGAHVQETEDFRLVDAASAMAHLGDRDAALAYLEARRALPRRNADRIVDLGEARALLLLGDTSGAAAVARRAVSASPGFLLDPRLRGLQGYPPWEAFADSIAAP